MLGRAWNPLVLGSMLLAASTIVAVPARAQEAPAKPISAGLLIGAGIAFEDVNPWGFGFGLRGGYNFQQIYTGLRFNYYLGETYEAVTPGGPLAETAINLWELGIEAGYDFAVAERVTVRPQLGLGIASITIDQDALLFGASVSGTDTDLYLAIGASGFYDITPEIFVGVEPRLQFVFGGDTVTALVLMATVGMRFGI